MKGIGYMNITPILANLLPVKNEKAQSNHLNSNYVAIQPNSLNYLAHDTVSFGIKNPIKAPAKKSNTIEDILRKTYEDRMPSLRAAGTKLMDTLEVISTKFQDKGVSFDRQYAEHGIVKGIESFISKFLRSGATPQDRIRTTLYVSNPYDFKLIRDILSELKLRGYDIAKIPEKVNGKRVLVPDFDIRLSGVTEQNTKVLGAELQKCIGKPQKTGYEDIQMRLVDTNTKSKNAHSMELLIVYGKNFAKAKEAESYYSYDIRRMLNGILNVAQIPDPQRNSSAHRIQSNIKIISDILSNNISKPLFYNAKNLDFHNEKFQLPVELSKSNCEALNGLIEGIRTKISAHYREELTKVTSDDFKPELEKLVKASAEYKERADKTVYIKDLEDMKKSLIRTLRNQKKDDLDTIKQVQARFRETVEKYGKKD